MPLVAQQLAAYALARQEAGFAPIDPQAPLLVTPKGLPLYRKFVYRVVSANLGGMPNVPRKGAHTLRHTFATHMLDGGADLNDVKELMGHASLAATQVYTHTSIEKLKEAHRLAHPRA
jgi:integrase/recombinase XerC